MREPTDADMVAAEEFAAALRLRGTVSGGKADPDDTGQWTGIRQLREIREWSTNPEADEAHARLMRAKREEA